MVRRSSKNTKQEIVVIDPTYLTKEGLLVLQRYVDHGIRLPTVSSKSSYKDIWKHTKKFQATRRTMSLLAGKIQACSRQSPETYASAVDALSKEEFRVFLTTQSRSVDDLLDECDKMVHLCQEFEADSGSDLVKLQAEAEVTRLKVATNSKERRDLLLELTRAMPVIALVKDVLNTLIGGLKAIQKEVYTLENSSEVSLRRVIVSWEFISSCGVQFLT